MTKKLFQDVRDRLEKATEGPWRRSFIYIYSDKFPVADTISDDGKNLARIRGWGHLSTTQGEKKAQEIQDANGEFIAHTPTDIKRLLEALDLAVEVMQQTLEDYESIDKYGRSKYDRASMEENIRDKLVQIKQLSEGK